MVRYVMTLILYLGRNNKWMMKINLCLMNLKNTRDNIYIWISEPTNGAKYLVKGNNIFFK